MIFLDTDCISSFLWVKREHLLLGLKLGELVIPQEVFKELSNPSIPHIGRRVKELLVEGHLQTMDIMTGTEEARLFYQMVFKPTSGLPLIGKGEASVLALAKVHRGIVASNNLKDIGFYLTKYYLKEHHYG